MKRRFSLLILFALPIFVQGQKLPELVRNNLGVPGYPGAKANFYHIEGGLIFEAELVATTFDHSVKIKAFYLKYLLNAKVVDDGNERYLSSSPMSRNLVMTSLGKFGQHVRIRCWPEGKGKTQFQVISIMRPKKTGNRQKYIADGNFKTLIERIEREQAVRGTL